MSVAWLVRNWRVSPGVDRLKPFHVNAVREASPPWLSPSRTSTEPLPLWLSSRSPPNTPQIYSI